jgi:hypothetical protein
MQSTPRQIQALADDLRQLVYKLAKVDEYEASLAHALRPAAIAEPSSEQMRADACLIVIQAMLGMKIGDKLSVECTDHAAYTLTLTPLEPLRPC